MFALIFMPQFLAAQGGSNYSIFGIGDIFSGANASYQAMGGTHIAVPSDHSINIKNPAMWSTATSTRLMAGYNFNQHLNETDDATLYQNNGQISGLFTLFSIDTGLGISASFGLHSFSNMNYLVSSSFSISKDDITQNGRNTFQGSGGLSSAYLGASTKVIDNLFFGASAFIVFGPLATKTITEFDGSYSYNYQVTQADFASGWGSRLGLYYNYAGFGIGAYYESLNKFDFDRERTYTSSMLTDTVVKSSFSQSMPASFGVGLSYRTGKFLLAADMAIAQTSKLEYNIGKDVEFQDATRYSFGLNRLGNPSRAADYLDRMSYKFGFYYQDQYYKINNNSISEIGFSFGSAMPVGIGGMLDAAFVFGTRGVSSDNLIKEYFGKMYIEISVGEIWFKPFRKRY